MTNRRFRFWYLVIKLAIYAAFGIVILCLKDTLVQTLKHFIGGLLLLYGVEDIVFLVLTERKEFYREDKTYIGIAEVILGVGLLFAPLDFDGVCIAWASWTILREAIEIKELIIEFKNWVPRILSLVESLVAIGFAVVLIFTPTSEHASLHLTLLTIELILAPLIPLLELLLTKDETEESAES